MTGRDDPPARPRIQLPASGLASEVLEAAQAQVSFANNPILSFADELIRRESAVKEAAPDPETPFVVFELNGELYGVDVGYVLEALKVPPIVRVPAAPAHVRGVTHVRGRVLPVVEIRTSITLTALELSERSRLLIVSVFGRTLGLLVDALHDVIALSRSQIEAPPPELAQAGTGYVRGISRAFDRLLLVMDLERAIHPPNQPDQASP